MSLATVLALINQEIVPNNNNEITANVLRPILIEMLQQPNELIGLLSNLTTTANTNLVEAINEINDSFSQLNGINIFQGIGNPNDNTSLSPNLVDFYSQLNNQNNIVDLWIFTGIEWVSLNSNRAVLYTPQVLQPLEQQTARDNILVYSRDEVDALFNGLSLQKHIITHVVTSSEVSDPVQILITLPNTPNVNDFYDLHINGGYVNDNDYLVSGNTLTIIKANIAYPITEGKRITFRYKY